MPELNNAASNCMLQMAHNARKTCTTHSRHSHTIAMIEICYQPYCLAAACVILLSFSFLPLLLLFLLFLLFIFCLFFTSEFTFCSLQELLQCLKELLRIDKAWLPRQEGYSMYIRPFAFSSAHSLGISKPSRYSPSRVIQHLLRHSRVTCILVSMGQTACLHRFLLHMNSLSVLPSRSMQTRTVTD